jgi:predicted MPP superfamily phosphohydrolase
MAHGPATERCYPVSTMDRICHIKGRMITRRRFLGSVAALGIAAPGYAFGVEPGFSLVVRTHRIAPPLWPRGMGLRIAAVADIHMGEPYMSLARLEGIVERVNRLRADIIVLLGDYEAGHRYVTRPVLMADTARVLAQLGVHAVLGNHDWWNDRDVQRSGAGPTHVHRAFEMAGLPVLENRSVRIADGPAPFWLLGLGDQLAFPRRGFAGVDDLPGTLAQISDGAPAILLAPEPDIFPRVPDRVALTLSGHTHGGQVRLLGYSPLVPSRYGNRFAYGHVREGARDIVISGGLGCSNLPVRLGVPPEITVIELG